jgi:long-chain fatty acid transport protein
MLCLASPGFATDGNMLVGVGPIQMGTNGAGAARPQDSTWALINPAGLVDLDRRVDLYLNYLELDRSVEPRGFIANPFAGTLEDDGDIVFPSMGMVYPLKRGGVLGVGMFGVMGNAIDLPAPRTWPGLPKHADRRSSYEVARIPITYAYRFDNGWSVGASIVGVYSRFRTDSLTLRLRPTRGGHEWDYAFGVGFNLSVYKKWEKWSASAMYSSRHWMQDFDKYKDDLVKHGLDMPQEFRLGIGHQLTPRVALMFDYRYIDWEGVAQYGKKNTQSGLAWKNQHIFKLGAEWDANDKWTFRGGVAYGKSPVRRDVTFVNALFTALADTHVSAGLSYAINDRSDLHFAVTHSIPEEQIESGQGDVFSRAGKGTPVKYREWMYTLGYTWKF